MNPPNETAASITLVNGILAMSSLEISKLTGKRHDNVIRDIEGVLSELGKDRLNFEGIYLDSQNREQPLFHLPKRECLILVSGYSVKLRAAIIDRWQELESQVAKPLTREQQILAELAEIRSGKAKAILADAFAPTQEYGSIAANGLPRLGARRGTYVTARARLEEAEAINRQLRELDALDAQGQGLLAI